MGLATGAGWLMLPERFIAQVHNLAKTHCVHGHPFSGENVLIDRRGWRACRECRRRRQRVRAQAGDAA